MKVDPFSCTAGAGTCIWSIAAKRSVGLAPYHQIPVRRSLGVWITRG
jgi:hypothetical protein